MTMYDENQNVILNSNVNNTITYTGRRYDSESDLYFYRNRMYSPELSRFISKDPKGYIDGMNLYAYVKNNPLRYLDAMGTTAYQSYTDENGQSSIVSYSISGRTIGDIDRGEYTQTYITFDGLSESLPNENTIIYGKRGLEPFGILIPSYQSKNRDKENTEVLHEDIVFMEYDKDGIAHYFLRGYMGDNSENGGIQRRELTEDELKKYEFSDKAYEIENIDENIDFYPPGYDAKDYDLMEHNCQDYVDAIHSQVVGKRSTGCRR